MGVVGTKTLTSCDPVSGRALISPLASVEMKPMAQMSRRGYWIRQAFSKLRSDWANTVSAICFTPL